MKKVFVKYAEFYAEAGTMCMATIIHKSSPGLHDSALHSLKVS